MNCGSRTIRQWYDNVGTSEHDQINHVLDVSEAVRTPDNQLDFVVHRFHSGVADLLLDGVQDVVLVAHDLALELHELRDAAMPRPLNPLVERVLCFFDIRHLQQEPQVFLEQIAAVEPVVVVLDHLQLALLALRQVLRRFAESKGRALDFFRFLAGSRELGGMGVVLFRTSLAVLAELPHSRLRSAPRLAPHLVECVHAPFHDMEGVDAARGIRQVLLDARCNPLCAVRRHGLDGCALLFRQALHEPGEDVFPVALASPHDGVRLVVHDDGDVLVSLAVAGLVDADANKPVEALAGVRLEVLVRAMDATSDGVPLDAHVRGNGALAQLEGHPRHHHVERLRELRAREGPRHAGGMNAVLGAEDARQAVAKVDENAVVVQGTPQTRLRLRMVVSGATFSADGAEMLLPFVRA